MLNDKGLSKVSRRLLVVLCTVLLAGGTFLVLGISVWAQEQPAQSGGSAQPAQDTGSIQFWEPQIGTRTVYYMQDINDIHGEVWGPVFLGYFDIDLLYDDPLWPEPYQLYDSHYYTTDGISNLNPVYFDLVGPWYFRMTTPYKLVEEVIGIHEAPDAAKFPAATYAVKFFIIGSGGVRTWGIVYRSNDAGAQKWYEWGGSVEYFIPGEEKSTKSIVHYHKRSSTKDLVAYPLASFPYSTGGTGSIEEYYVEIESHSPESGVHTDLGDYVSVPLITVVAQGKITVPAGTYDATLIKYDWTVTRRYGSKKFTEIEYAWLVQGVGVVTDITSLPNELGPTFKTATDIQVMEVQTTPAAQK
ncbi:MAG: hypothetical protein A2Y75_07700 [Candidatus Solincola sediminis]|uniref:Uncharacterized protein n=1 Tax=Candidatus Solincola sediminis TaxID=1797199 RepID=A0A1F2WKE4_9ACTN|nr:MAG: hypothetical protein A2Y75_07700 [Candidatus Solincola sediminis]